MIKCPQNLGTNSYYCSYRVLNRSYPPARKNQHTPVNGVKEFVCLSWKTFLGFLFAYKILIFNGSVKTAYLLWVILVNRFQSHLNKPNLQISIVRKFYLSQKWPAGQGSGARAKTAVFVASLCFKNSKFMTKLTKIASRTCTITWGYKICHINFTST